MAMYDYQCNKCQRNFTIKQTFAQHDRAKQVNCPTCGSTARRLITAVHVKTAKKS